MIFGCSVRRSLGTSRTKSVSISRVSLEIWRAFTLRLVRRTRTSLLVELVEFCAVIAVVLRVDSGFCVFYVIRGRVAEFLELVLDREVAGVRFVQLVVLFSRSELVDERFL